MGKNKLKKIISENQTIYAFFWIEETKLALDSDGYPISKEDALEVIEIMKTYLQTPEEVIEKKRLETEEFYNKQREERFPEFYNKSK